MTPKDFKIGEKYTYLDPYDEEYDLVCAFNFSYDELKELGQEKEGRLNFTSEDVLERKSGIPPELALPLLSFRFSDIILDGTRRFVSTNKPTVKIFRKYSRDENIRETYQALEKLINWEEN